MADLNVEELASRCLQRMQDEGQQVLEEMCAQHHEHADEIRGMVAQLIKLGLFEEPLDEELKQVGDFKILRRLGGGGMGVVYLALQESLGRHVALKVMRPGFSVRGQSKARFQREIEAISAIDHPGVCTVYEAGEANAVPYLAMRYIEGETLAQILNHQRREKQEGKPTSSGGTQELYQLLDCAEKAARALHCAHEAGLVHRDVKPGNIMIDTHGEPVILDFGLVQDAGVDSHDLTASGDLLGTPPYMSPEQVEGKIVDRRSDIYSLAATLYECLTLSTPFTGANRQVIYNKILSDPPPDPRKKNRSISKDLWIVLSKALEKDPRLRFSSAFEFAEELRRIQSHQPIQTVRPSIPVRALRWTQRNRAATAVMLTVSVAFILSLWLLRRSRVAETRLRALGLLGEAMDLKDRDTTLAFKLAREAWRVDPSNPDPRIQGRLQEIIQDIMSGLVPHKVLARGKSTYDRVLFSSQGNFLLIMGRDQESILCTGEGDRIDVDLPMVRTRHFPGAFSPDEKELAIAGREGRIFRYDLTTSPPRKIWESKSPVYPHIWTVAYHDFSEERRLLVCSANGVEAGEGIDNRMTVWTLGREDPVDIHRRGGMRWKSGAWLPNGRIVAVGALWDADGSWVRDLLPREKAAPPVPVEASMKKEEKKALPAGVMTPYVRLVRVSPRHFLTITHAGFLRVYEHDGREIWTRSFEVKSLKRQVTEASIDPTGRSILVTFQDGRVRLIDAATGDLRKVDLEFHPRRTILAASFSRNGDRITVGNWGGRIGAWDLHGTSAENFLAHSNGICSLAYSPDEKRLLTASFAGVVKLWDMEQHASKRMLRGISWPFLDVSPDGRRLAIIDEWGRLALTDEEGRVQAQVGEEFQSPYKGVTILGFSPGGTKLLIHTVDRPLLVVDLSGQSPVKVGPKASRADIARFLPDETVFYTRSGVHQDLMIWNPQTGKTEDLYVLPDDEVYDRPRLSCGDVSKDGESVVVGDMTGRVFVVDRSGKKVWKIPSKVGLVRDVCFSKDGRYILAGTEDGHAYLWDRESSRVQSFGPQSSGLIKVIFSPDEKQVVLGYKSGRIRIWDRETGTKVLELAGHDGQQIHSLVYTRSGWLVSSGSDATVRWWCTDVDQLNQAIEAISIPKLTPEERRQFPDLFPHR